MRGNYDGEVKERVVYFMLARVRWMGERERSDAERELSLQTHYSY